MCPWRLPCLAQQPLISATYLLPVDRPRLLCPTNAHPLLPMREMRLSSLPKMRRTASGNCTVSPQIDTRQHNYEKTQLNTVGIWFMEEGSALRKTARTSAVGQIYTKQAKQARVSLSAWLNLLPRYAAESTTTSRCMVREAQVCQARVA